MDALTTNASAASLPPTAGNEQIDFAKIAITLAMFFISILSYY